MAHQRTSSSVAADALKEPHSVSLKVLRLSRPSFAVQHPLPSPSTTSTLANSINPAASLAYPAGNSEGSNDSFILSPLLTLPPAFGNAYVGETFACTLCANNELLPDAESTRRVSGVQIESEMKTPSITVPLDVAFASSSTVATTKTSEKENRGNDKGRDIEPGQSLQGIVDFHLKEEGNHVLAVTVSYMETGSTSGRVRSFRKLYQFVARGCLVVRTKIGPLPEAAIKSNVEGMEGVTYRKRWALEAQLENSGEDIIVLDLVALNERPWCKATGLNWEMEAKENSLGEAENPILSPGDVQQVCFFVEQKDEETEQDVDETGRLVMGILSIGWRGALGNRGSLSTGWLGTRSR